ncbi:MAG: PAS domain-containing sensor histidine kinase [Deltaproteobacteria bacterium]|nr:PAS domain-containing sensor histidine kinase [Deltaproteobacteria bacterium]
MLELRASAGMYTHVDGPHGRVPVGKFKIGLIAEEQVAHVSNDVPNDPRVGDPAWAVANGMVAFAGYPLLVQRRCVGVVAMFARHALAPDTLDSVAAVADAIAQGIERKRAEESLELRARELARSNAELERFAYVASHDLQEPLRMVASYTQLLGRRYKGKLDEAADEFIGFAVDGANRMQALINDLLSFSRVGTRATQLVTISLEQPVKAAMSNLKTAIDESQAKVTYDPLPTLAIDQQQMTQVFQNLIGNALKFRGESAPAVHVSAQPNGDDWQITVRDNGIGISEEFFDNLFVLFQRLHTRTEYPGNGIGLAICKKIIERHGGRIWVESKPGEGAAFLFTLRGGES